jgi:hypothetical protein
MAFLICPLADFLQDCAGAGPLKQNITVLQNCFPVKLHGWMADNQMRLACPAPAPLPDAPALPA